MENTKNFFENWVDSQSKMYDNWVNTTQNFQKSFNGNPMNGNGTEMLNDWMNKGREAWNNFSNSTKQTAENANQGFNNYFTQWADMQKKATDMWTEAGRQMTSFFANQTANNWYDQARQYQDNWVGQFRNMANAMNSQMTGNWNDYTSKTLQDTFAAMQKGTEAYFKFYELWQPVLKNLQDNAGQGADQLRAMLDPSKYKEFMDKMFNFDAINPMNDYIQQYGKYMAGFMEQARGMYPGVSQWPDAFKNFAPQAAGFGIDAFRNLHQQFQKSVSPFFRLAGNDKQKEMNDIINDTLDKYAVAAEKLTQLQKMIYVNGAQAMEQMLNSVIAKAKEGKRYENFSELYNEWVNTSGQAFEQLFATDEFSKLQGDLVALDAELRKNMERQMEMMLAPYPVVLRSQMDELYKSNYEMRKRLHAMEKQMRNNQEQVDNQASVVEETFVPKATGRRKS